MSSYSFTISMDGEDLGTHTALSIVLEESIEEARQALMSLAPLFRPVIAECLMTIGDREDRRELGVWTYDRTRSALEWRASWPQPQAERFMNESRR